MGQEPPLLSELMAAEEGIWNALVAGDAAADADALAEEFLGVYPTGFAGKSDHAGQLQGGPTVEAYRLSGARILPLGEDRALLAYHAAYRRPGMAEEAMYVSSIWERRESAWINLFSQDTPATGEPVP